MRGKRETGMGDPGGVRSPLLCLLEVLGRLLIDLCKGGKSFPGPSQGPWLGLKIKLPKTGEKQIGRAHV